MKREDTRPISIDLIVPFYNPSGDWSANLIHQLNLLSNELRNYSLRLILVNDGSSSHFKENIKNIEEVFGGNFTYVSCKKNRGKGSAIREGVKVSTSEYILYTDIDIPYSQQSMVNLVHKLDQGADVVLGEREDQYFERISRTRWAISKIVRKLIVWIDLPVKDTQCGLKGFNKTAKDLFLKTKIDRFLFDMEFVFLLSKEDHMDIRCVPVILRDGIFLSKANLIILMTEFWNFIKLMNRK